MTRARRITQGERTHSQIVHDPANPVVASTEPQVGEPRQLPDRMCKSCTKAAAADPDATSTVYGVVIAPSGLGHYTAEADRTLCGSAINDDWTTT